MLITGGTFTSGVRLESSVAAPNGLTAETASTSAYAIKQAYPASTDGVYWIQNTNINSGNAVQVYCDMTTLGGGWTLLVQNNSDSGWDNSTTLSRNATTPPSSLFVYNSGQSDNNNYSIVGWADYIKRSASGFDYMIDAGYRGRNGAAYTANEAYSFTEAYSSQSMGSPALDQNGWRKNITEIERFPAGGPGDTATWDYDQEGLEARMPWCSGGQNNGAFLTTDGFNSGWWGTLIGGLNGVFNPAPWIASGTSGSITADIGWSPQVIWYWVR